tara:strand:+ start:1456 stop:1914 length:459 start_codon:yes stop_codon:yes gene_type:complete
MVEAAMSAHAHLPVRWSTYDAYERGGSADTTLLRLKRATLREVKGHIGIDVEDAVPVGMFTESVSHALFEDAVRMCLLVDLQRIAQLEDADDVPPTLVEGWNNFYASFDPANSEFVSRSLLRHIIPDLEKGRIAALCGHDDQLRQGSDPAGP